MPIYRRGKFYHYRFMLGGKDHHGSTKCTKERAALAFERNKIGDVRETLKDERPREALKRLYDKAVVALAGDDRIALDKAWERFKAQPVKRDRCEARDAATESRWNDFLAFMKDRYPEIRNLCEVTPSAAREYIGHIQRNGRWQRTGEYERRFVPSRPPLLYRRSDVESFMTSRRAAAKCQDSGADGADLLTKAQVSAQYGVSVSTVKRLMSQGLAPVATSPPVPAGQTQRVSRKNIAKLSPAAKNDFLRTCRMMCRRLMPIDPAIAVNPFDGIDLLAEDWQERGFFDVTEVVRLYELAKTHVDRDIILPLIVMGAGLALREGDIAMLRWKHVDLYNEMVTKFTEKTGKSVSIPLWDPEIVRFLRETRRISGGVTDSDFCFPELAAMYNANRTGVSYRFKRFLEDAGYRDKTTTVIKGRDGELIRDRATSTLDVHALRHSFAAIAGAAGVPLKTVQLVLGHMNERITERYWRHAKDKELREKLAAMPHMFGPPVGALPAPPPKNGIASLRDEVHRRADVASAAVLRRMLAASRE